MMYVYRMRITSSTELRNNLAKYLDQVHDDHTPMIITREGGKPAAVIMSFEDYTSHEETMQLLRNPNNAADLLASMAELDAGKGTERKLTR
jgi:antitoxin YefM